MPGGRARRARRALGAVRFADKLGVGVALAAAAAYWLLGAPGDRRPAPAAETSGQGRQETPRRSQK